MAIDLSLADLSRLDRVRQVLSAHDPRGQFTALGMHEVHISDRVLDDLTDVIDRHLARTGRPAGQAARVRMIADPVRILRNGADLKSLVMDRLSARYDAAQIILDDGHPVLHADEAMQDAGAKASVGADCIVSVGGGTITDIAKIAAMRAGVPVHVVVQTAASVDGFTDNFSVVLQNGVKRTLLTRWPEAVLTDTSVIAGAPQHLNASGFGELMSMYCAPGDWFLAARFGIDNSFAPVLLDMLNLCGEGFADWSIGIGAGEPAACARLAQALAMRGIVTGVGGTTASLSGMEHLVSHMLDMVQAETGGATGLHGAQVGVGSVIRAAAWEEFCARMAEAPLKASDLFPDIDATQAQVLAAFADLDPSGRIGTECWGRYRSKLQLWHDAQPQVEAFLANWDAERVAHDRLVLGSHAIAAALHRARAAKLFTELDPAPSVARFHWIVGNCQFMRERFTVADLLHFGGWWDQAGVARVMDRVTAACLAAETAR